MVSRIFKGHSKSLKFSNSTGVVLEKKDDVRSKESHSRNSNFENRT